MYKQTRIKPFEFVSVVSGGGYEWIRAAALNKGTPSPVGLFLVARVEPGVAAKAHEPLEHTGLFREFSELATKRAAILKFANAYGPLLGLPFPVAQTDGRGRFKSGKHLLVGGERFEQWTTAITEMRTLIGLWRAIVERDHGALRRVVVWHEDYVSYQVSMA
jgi:hypothetical protein